MAEKERDNVDTEIAAQAIVDQAIKQGQQLYAESIAQSSVVVVSNNFVEFDQFVDTETKYDQSSLSEEQLMLNNQKQDADDNIESKMATAHSKLDELFPDVLRDLEISTQLVTDYNPTDSSENKMAGLESFPVGDIDTHEDDRLSISSAKIDFVFGQPNNNNPTDKPKHTSTPVKNKNQQNGACENKTGSDQSQDDDVITADDNGEELREMVLYVQGNQQLQLGLFMVPGAMLDKMIIQNLWRDVLSVLASLDVSLKSIQNKQEENPTSQLNYKYIKFNNVDKKLEGHVGSNSQSLQAISAEENHFCSRATELHNEFNCQSNLQELTLRSSSHIVYAQRRAAQDVYYQQVLPARHVMSAPSERDAILLVEKRARETLLKNHNNLVI